MSTPERSDVAGTSEGSQPSMPSVSIVIPFGKSLSDLIQQLDALSSAPLTAVDAEVIVSCNLPGGVEPVQQAISLLSEHSRFRAIDSSATRGPSSARNAGWRQARSETILFCDSDDVVDPGWLEAGLAALRTNHLIAGALEYRALNATPPSEEEPYLSRGTAQKFHHLPAGSSSNMGARKRLLEDLNGFDEALSAAEDVDLFWRAQYAGYSLHFEPAFVVHYRMTSESKSHWRTNFRNGRADVHLLRLHHRWGARYTSRDAIYEVTAALWAAIHAPLSAKWRTKFIKRTAKLAGYAAGIADVLRETYMGPGRHVGAHTNGRQEQT